jgi:hypothetical protein
VKSSVQTNPKRRILFGEVNKVRRANCLDVVTLFFKPQSGAGLRVFLSRKDKGDIPSFVQEWHSVGKRVSECRPCNVYSQELINPSTCHIKTLVP